MECKDKNFVFISIFEKLVDKNGITIWKYYKDNIHLGYRALPAIVSQINKKVKNFNIKV